MPDKFSAYYLRQFPELEGDWGKKGEPLYNVVKRFLDTASEFIDKELNNDRQNDPTICYAFISRNCGCDSCRHLGL